MINFFLKFKTRKHKNSPPDIDDINNANKILWAIFTRYGDTIIDLVVIKEFIERYPDKEYLILCPRQMKPYVSELLPNIECFALNKRNLLDMIKANKLLKKKRPDIGFNPWSSGLDSCFFLTYCKKYLCYKNFKRPKIINHYQVVRRYLQLPEHDWGISELTLKGNYQKILICPQSTDSDRSISSDQLDKFILNFRQKNNNAEITIASMSKRHFRKGCNQLLFEKTAQSSQQLINLMKRSDFIVCSDSGPLHIASALNKSLMAVFKVIKPDIVLNAGSTVSIINCSEE